MKRHRPISDYFISKQTRNTSPTNDDSALPSDDAHLCTHLHCSSECCRELTESNQPINPAILSQTTKIQGTGSSQKKKKRDQFNHGGANTFPG